MLKANLYNSTGELTGQADLPESLFGLKVRSHHLYRGVTTYLSRQRLGTQSTKTRGEVSGGGKKPFKQKGTGNARQGSTRAVQFVKGGVAHAPKPRDYSLELPKKARRQAIAESLSDKAERGFLKVVEKLEFAVPKTKQALDFLKKMGLVNQSTLIILEQNSQIVRKSFANLPDATVISCNNINVFDVLKHDSLVVTRGALDTLVSTFGSTKKEGA